MTHPTDGPLIAFTESSRYFAELLRRQIPGAELLETERKRFGDGERYLKLEVGESRLSLFGRDIIFVASTVTDDDINEVGRVGSAIAKYGAHRLIYALPFFGYSTMERAVKPGEVVTAKVLARQLSQLPGGDVRNCFLMMDLHAPGFTHYFEGECLRFELYAEAVLADAIAGLGLSNFMFASADLGRTLWVNTFARRFETPIAFARKTRTFETTEVHEVIGTVEGMHVVIYDDMIRSAKTLIHATDAYLAQGALSVSAATSHLALNNEGIIDVLIESPLRNILATNSHPMSQHPRVLGHPKFGIVDASPLFVQAIQKLRG